jgi:hypothetical protein
MRAMACWAKAVRATAVQLSHGSGHRPGMGQAAMDNRVDAVGVGRACSLVAGAVAIRAMACWVGVVRVIIGGWGCGCGRWGGCQATSRSRG